MFGDDVDSVLGPLASMLRIRIQDAAPSEAEVEAAFVRWLDRLAAQRPVILAVEDTQWADAATRRLLERVLELTDRAPIGVVLTEEPIPSSEGAALRLHALADYGHRASELALRPISEDAAEHLLTELVGDRLEPATRIGLLREAEGNPLYLVELARAFLDGALEQRGRTWTVSIGSLELLPPSLENLLVARIDRLADEPRRLAQIAAAIGRTFPVTVLERVAGADVAQRLTALLRAEIVREVARYPELECTFTHGLLREAALSTLTSTRKRVLYAEIAAAFEDLYAASLDEHLERLAHYHAQAGNLPKSLEYAARARTPGVG
jgi:predicted ATPase